MRSPEDPPADDVLHEFFHACPVGLVSFADDGSLRLMNPAAVALLRPAGSAAQLADIFDLLGPYWPELPAVVRSADHGRVLDDHRVAINATGRQEDLSCSLIRVDDDVNMLVMADITRLVQAEGQRERLLELERHARRRTEFLQRCAARMAAAVTVEELAQTIIDEFAGSLDTDIVTLNVTDGVGFRIHASPATLVAVTRTGVLTVEEYTRAEVDDLIPGPEVIRSNTPIHLHSADQIEEMFPSVARALRDRPLGSLYAGPVRDAAGVAIGAIVVGSPEPDWLDQPTLSVIDGIADLAGPALERARMFDEVSVAREREHEIARRLQTALLPDQLVTHPAIDVAAMYEAAAEYLTVGGDWYDSFRWEDGSLGLVVGDVAGHDVDSTAVMGQLRSSMAALAPVTGPEPAKLLAQLDTCVADVARDAFATASCVVIGPGGDRLTYASAGHPPALIMGADGQAQWLDQATSPPIGVRVARRAQATVVLEAPWTCLLYSDGLIERRDEPIDAGIERLGRVAAEHRHLAPSALVAAIVEAMTSSATLTDDLVVLAASGRSPRRSAEPSRR